MKCLIHMRNREAEGAHPLCEQQRKAGYSSRLTNSRFRMLVTSESCTEAEISLSRARQEQQTNFVLFMSQPR